MNSFRSRSMYFNCANVTALLACCIVFAPYWHAATGSISQIWQKERESDFRTRFRGSQNKFPVRRMPLNQPRYFSVVPASARVVPSTAAVQLINSGRAFAGRRKQGTQRGNFNRNIRENNRRTQEVRPVRAKPKWIQKTVRAHAVPSKRPLKSTPAKIKPLTLPKLRKIRKRLPYKTRVVRTRTKIFGNATAIRLNNSQRLMYFKRKPNLIGRARGHPLRRTTLTSALPFSSRVLVVGSDSLIQTGNNLPIFSVHKIQSLPSRSRFRYRNFSSEDLEIPEKLIGDNQSRVPFKLGVGQSDVVNYGLARNLPPIDPILAINPVGERATENSGNSTEHYSTAVNSTIHWWRGYVQPSFLFLLMIFAGNAGTI